MKGNVRKEFSKKKRRALFQKDNYKAKDNGKKTSKKNQRVKWGRGAKKR
jgi:hypothetical protein